MRPSCLLIRRAYASSKAVCQQRRQLLTLAIETSCDDTSVALLEKHPNNSATLHFHEKITCDNREWEGVNPLSAHISHQETLSALVKQALQKLPVQRPAIAHIGNSLLVPTKYGTETRRKPDFIAVTRGPGMRSNLNTGLDTAKGLAVAWQIPLLGVNHMQAHALTPRLVSALEMDSTAGLNGDHSPAFPFLSLLVSGGHTMLVHSRDLCDHEILASSSDLAIGNLVDKAARDILPASTIKATSDVMYGRTLEKFAFPEEKPDYNYRPVFNNKGNFERLPTAYERSLGVPFVLKPYEMEYSFSGIGAEVRRWMDSKPDMDNVERQVIAREAMRVAFEHLASRVLLALSKDNVKDVKSLVVSGGVASNQYLKHILRQVLDARGFEQMALVFPPPKLCTDNAAMIAWTGIEMYEAGWRTNLDALAINRWSIDPRAEDGGILGCSSWAREEKVLL
ncbi:tRNA N6-adenosine threonylcarbamoyltransferase [Coleophoma cylindrospora]|uniref:N(6)-L-threonylcarbamoyladenine synthase n=1 Tax=Coleophoma cylindrospora TaxID=1849047 RepID=A0A3D8SFT8_9HELO|nr:tRNA N6-adenosine threonylcarbamoyltransferase [Coleophoma cylindrospora]